MNVRFSPHAVRCRVTSAELERLLSGRAITLEVTLPRDHAFRLNIRPGALATWQLDSDPTGIWLTIPRVELETLAKALPSKAGLEKSFALTSGEVRISFEVDLSE
jgi:hypothetical protein